MHYQLGELSFKRLEYLSLPVPGELLGLADDQVTELNWESLPWVEGGQPVISAAAWGLEVAGKRVVFDPVQAVDVVLRSDDAAEQQHQNDVAAKFEAEGFTPDAVDVVLLTHIEGVGIVAKRENGQWQPFFPNAKVFVSDEQLESFLAQPKDDSDPTSLCWHSLIDQGVVATYADGEEVLPGVLVEVTGEHGPGHSVFHFNGGEATFIGHLAVTAVHLATGPCEALNQKPEGTFEVLHKIAADGRTLIGPLWPEPGIGRWQDDKVVPVGI